MNSFIKSIAIASVISTGFVSAVTTGFVEPASAKPSYHVAQKVKKNIVQTAQATPSLSTLVSAVVAADLAGTLSSKGPFTVFAPDNNAFAKIKVPSDKITLAKVLTYHVVPGRLTAEQLHDGQVLTTANGQTLKVIKKKGSVKLKSTSGNVVTVKAANIKTSNGIVHVINRVLIPGG